MISDNAISAAIRTIAPKAPDYVAMALLSSTAAKWIRDALDTRLRAAHFLGQCAHESTGFRHQTENLNYSSAGRIVAVFGAHRFQNATDAEQFVRKPQALANRVYAHRNGNGDEASGDGWRYRGRGWIQITGRANYRDMAQLIGFDFEASPQAAAYPDDAWRIAAAYMATRKSRGRTALEWADRNDVLRVTRIINGGTLGLDDRRLLTDMALGAINSVENAGGIA